MAPNHTRSARNGYQLQLAATIINRDPRCAGPNRREGRSLPEQFFHQRSFQHHAFGSHTNTDSDTERNTYCHSYWDTNSNADTECHANSDGYSYRDADGYSYGDAHGYTDNYAKAHTNTKTSSVTAAKTVGGPLPLNDERLLRSRNSGPKTQSM